MPKLIGYTVRLEGGTVGTIDSDCIDGPVEDFIGKEVEVALFDKCGNGILRTGALAEILGEKTLVERMCGYAIDE